MKGMAVKPSKLFPSKIYSVCGDHKVFPRVGSEYQAEIPELIEPPFIGGIKVDASDSSSLGLPVPVTWIYNKAQVNRGELIEITNNHDQVASNQNDSVEPENNVDGEVKIDNGEAVGLLNLPSSMLGGKSTDIDSAWLQEKKALCDGFYLVPGLPNKDWNPIECSSFLLGLFIFGKNLAVIRRFVGNKDMGDMLSYYYGKFYESKDHQRWSDTRKVRGRRCISGQKLFTGWRQQEILTRLSLSSYVSKECLHLLLKVSKLFEDGKISLEEYVFTLRDNVGIDNLVEAVGIGKGKEDLTGTAIAIQSLPHHPKLPSTKACSSLAITEILNPEMEGDPVVLQKKQHSMEFTVVDTSLFTGVGSGKVWEVRSLAVDSMNSGSSEDDHGSDPVGVDNMEKHGDADWLKDQLPNNGPFSLIKEEKITQSSTEVSVCSHKTESRHKNDEWLKDQSSFPDAQKLLSDSCLSEQSHKNSVLDNSEDDQVFSTNTLNNPDSLSAAKQCSSPCETDQHSDMLESINAGPITTTCRRQSSRSKPSAKALEAIAYGFMGASKKRKTANTSTSTSTSSQRVRGG